MGRMEWLILFDSQLGLPMGKVVILNQNFLEWSTKENKKNYLVGVETKIGSRLEWLQRSWWIILPSLIKKRSIGGRGMNDLIFIDWRQQHG